MHQVHGVGDEGLEAWHQPEVPLADLVGVERQAVVHLGEDAVLLAQHELELLAEDLGVEQVLHPQPHPERLVGVGGPDPALGGPELVLAQVALGHTVELLVVRHDQVRVPGQRRRRVSRPLRSSMSSSSTSTPGSMTTPLPMTGVT